MIRVHSRLVDITCNSDGKVDQFISPETKRDTLPLHLPARAGPGPYLLGFFLMGAYLVIMGDMHNLFGRVNEVHMFLDSDEESGYYIEEVIEGTSIVSVLDMVQYDERHSCAASRNRSTTPSATTASSRPRACGCSLTTPMACATRPT